MSSLLVNDEELNDVGISIVDRNGVITLSGIVTSNKMKKRAETLVTNHDDVVSIVNDLTVASDEGEKVHFVPPIAGETHPV